MRAWLQRSSVSESLHFAAGHHRRRPIIMPTTAMSANVLNGSGSGGGAPEVHRSAGPLLMATYRPDSLRGLRRGVDEPM